MKKPKNDRALRFYNEVLGVDRLHFGLWRDDDELSFQKLKAAQKRYEDYLIESIPESAKRILDVGCGTGAMSERLVQLGFDVEGLSPDINQKKVFHEKVNAGFHFCRFEEFVPGLYYDCIIMSESSQYISLPALFKVAARSLGHNGYLMVSDYFVLREASGILAKSGHGYDQFVKEANKNNLQLLRDEDITDKVTKTLDMAKICCDKALLGLDIASEKIRIRHPYLTHFVFWLFRNKINGWKEEMQLIDSDKFKENKQYRFMLFQLDGRKTT